MIRVFKRDPHLGDPGFPEVQLVLEALQALVDVVQNAEPLAALPLDAALQLRLLLLRLLSTSS